MSSTTIMTSDESTNRPAPHLPADPLPDPEPAAPSLDQPDPGIYHPKPKPQTNHRAVFSTLYPLSPIPCLS